MAKRSSSSKNWLQEHFSDVYVRQAQQHGYRSRAYFKLAEIDQQLKLFHNGMCVVDLGAAPGGWSQYLSHRLDLQNSKIIAVDILPMEPLLDVEFICGDFTQDKVYQQLIQTLDGQQVDAVISDMAPNWSGCKHVDIPKTMYLVELAADFAQGVLRKDGLLLVKLFHGQGFDEFVKQMRLIYKKVLLLKPRASRDRSREVYLLAKGFKL